MKSDVSVLDVAFIVSVKGADVEEVCAKLRKVFGDDHVDEVDESIVVTTYPKGGDLRHFVKNKQRVITEIVSAAERKAQRKEKHESHVSRREVQGASSAENADVPETLADGTAGAAESGVEGVPGRPGDPEGPDSEVP